MAGMTDHLPNAQPITGGGDSLLAAFESERPRLVGLAYCMLGSVAEAENVVQDAFLRYQAIPPETVRAPGGFLTMVVSRLCLDVLKSARR